MMTKYIVLVAVSENGCIGINGSVPWHCSEDLKRFKKQTMGSAVVMGRKTYESIGKPLVGRKNIVMTRNRNLVSTDPNLYFCEGREIALDHCLQHDEVFIIGGADIYRQFLPLAHEIRMTKIPGTYDGDTSFPGWPLLGWKEVDKKFGEDDPRIEYVTYER